MDAHTALCEIHSQWDVLYGSGNADCGSVTTERGGRAWKVGRRFETEGTYVLLWLIHAAVW